MNASSEIPLARAALARFVAACFGESPEPPLSALTTIETRKTLRDAASALGISHDLIDGVLDTIPEPSAMQEARGRLLGHTVRSKCPPYELEYKRVEVFQQAQDLADIAAFYRAFGLEASGPESERADHIVPQWEFLSVVAYKEAIAAEEANQDGSECCRDGQRAFLRDHASFWMPAFFHRVKDAEPDGFHAGVVSLAAAVLETWCDSLQVPLGPQWLDLRPVEDDDMSITCGGAEIGGMVELGPRLSEAMERGA